MNQPTFIERLFRMQVKTNAVIEINNLLAKAQKISLVSPASIRAIAERYRITLPGKFLQQFQNLLREYMNCIFSVGPPTSEQFDEANCLWKLLSLDEGFFKRLQWELAAAMLKNQMHSSFADDCGHTEDDEPYKVLQQQLRLSNEDRENTFKKAAGEFVNKVVDDAVVDKRLSPQEDRRIALVQRNLGVNLTFDGQTNAILNKYRLFWTIENGEIPEVRVDISLQRGERCFFETRADWYEEKTVTTRIRYGGPTARIRIVRGVYWRVGDLGVSKVTKDVMVHIGSGKLYLTNKRLLFIGAQKSTTIRISNILEFSPYSDGVQITRDKGKNPFLIFEDRPDVFAAILSRLLSESAGGSGEPGGSTWSEGPQDPSGDLPSTGYDAGDDDMYDEAMRLVVSMGKASTSTLQRRLRIGYSRAVGLLERMEHEGIVGPADGSKPRDVLVGKPTLAG